MKAIIAAGGTGTRLRPLTFSSNKQLLPVLNKPLLLYPFEAVVETGIKEIGLVVNETRPAIESLLGDGSKWGVKIEYINQTAPLGLAHVVKISKEYLAGQPFVFMLGDNIFSQGIMKPYNKFLETQPDGLLTMVKHEHNSRMGVPYFDEQGKLLKVVEKPANPPNEYGIPGLYMFGPKVFEAFEGADAVKPSSRGELEITDLYTYLLDHNYKVETADVDGIWLDPGKFDDMIMAHKYLLEAMENVENLAKTDDSSQLSGLVSADEAVEIIKSQILGPVKIGAKVTIDNCTIGPNVTIGQGCNLKDLKISNSVIYEGSTLKHIDKPIVDSLIGKNTNIHGDDQESISFFIGDYCHVRTN